jgi:hypothetical protein
MRVHWSVSCLAVVIRPARPVAIIRIRGLVTGGLGRQSAGRSRLLRVYPGFPNLEW